MKTKQLKVKGYLVPDRDRPQDSKLAKKLPRYTRRKMRRIALNAGTGIGKTDGAQSMAKMWHKQGAKYVIIAFPKISIATSKRAPDWPVFYDGHVPDKYPKQFLCTWENLGKIPEEVLKNAVVYVDELHETATSGFRDALPGAFKRLFKLAPYIIGMTGTFNPLVFAGTFDLEIAVTQKKTPKRYLHDVLAQVPSGIAPRVFTPAEFIDWRMKHTKAEYFVIYVENKTILHELKKNYGGIVYHGGEAHKTILPDDAAVKMVETGMFPTEARTVGGRYILWSTSSLVAGWDLKAPCDVEVIVADTDSNLSRIETLMQAASRPRDQDEVHIYKLQGSKRNPKHEAAQFSSVDTKRRYKNLMKQLSGLSLGQLSLKTEEKYLLHADGTPSVLGKFEYRQRAIDRAYSSYASVRLETRHDYAEYMGFTGVFDEVAEQPSGVESFNPERSPGMKTMLIAEMPEGLDEKMLREFLDSDDELQSVKHPYLVKFARHCKKFTQPMTSTVLAIAQLLNIYDRAALLEYYTVDGEEWRDNTAEPATLVKHWKDFVEVSVINFDIRKRFMKDWRGEIVTGNDIKLWMQRNKWRFIDAHIAEKKCAVRARIETMVKGICTIELVSKANNGVAARFKVIGTAPLRVAYREDALRAAVDDAVRTPRGMLAKLPLDERLATVKCEDTASKRRYKVIAGMLSGG